MFSQDGAVVGQVDSNGIATSQVQRERGRRNSNTAIGSVAGRCAAAPDVENDGCTWREAIESVTSCSKARRAVRGVLNNECSARKSHRWAIDEARCKIRYHLSSFEESAALLTA